MMCALHHNMHVFIFWAVTSKGHLNVSPSVIRIVFNVSMLTHIISINCVIMSSLPRELSSSFLGNIYHWKMLFLLQRYRKVRRTKTGNSRKKGNSCNFPSIKLLFTNMWFCKLVGILCTIKKIVTSCEGSTNAPNSKNFKISALLCLYQFCTSAAIQITLSKRPETATE